MPANVEAVLHNLDSPNPTKRKLAVFELSKLSASSPGIVRALLVAADNDPEASIRHAADEALRVPCHQALVHEACRSLRQGEAAPSGLDAAAMVLAPAVERRTRQSEAAPGESAAARVDRAVRSISRNFMTMAVLYVVGMVGSVCALLAQGVTPVGLLRWADWAAFAGSAFICSALVRRRNGAAVYVAGFMLFLSWVELWIVGFTYARLTGPAAFLIMGLCILSLRRRGALA